MTRKKINPFLLQIIVVALAVIAVCILADKLKAGGGDEQLILAQDAVYKYAVQCYALEGFYPSDISYLEENYGLVLNDKYLYHYVCIGSNMMPEIKVFYVNE
jgi:hypothetical protein